MAPAASKMLGSPQPKLVGHCLVLAAKKGADVALKKLLVVGGAWRLQGGGGQARLDYIARGTSTHCWNVSRPV